MPNETKPERTEELDKIFWPWEKDYAETGVKWPIIVSQNTKCIDGSPVEICEISFSFSKEQPEDEEIAEAIVDLILNRVNSHAALTADKVRLVEALETELLYWTKELKGLTEEDREAFPQTHKEYKERFDAISEALRTVGEAG